MEASLNNPLVSIIVPVYNVEKYLHKCLDSLINQTYRNIEIVLVDDGSSDNSGTICDEYAANDRRVIVIHKKNEGAAIARIAGLDKSIGDFIVFVDSDDYIFEDYVEKMMNALIKYNVDLVSCQHNDIYNDIVKPIKRSVLGLYKGDDLIKMMSTNLIYDKDTGIGGITMMLCTKLFKRVILLETLNEGIGFWYGEDQLALLKILYTVSSIYVLPDYLYNYVHYSNQVTSKYRADKWDAYYRFWKREVEIDKDGLLDNQLPYRMWNYSINFYYSSFSYFSKYYEYETMTKHIFESHLIRQYVFGGQIKDLPKSRFESIMFFLLKYRLYPILYLQVKRIQNALKNA